MKRIFDVVVSLFVLVITSPVLFILALLIRFKLGSPIIFRQFRPGLYGRSFQLIKFRTMADSRDSEGKLLSDDLRLGRFGKFLRSTSLDELPSLVNVIKGEMSLVGPRPLLEEYMPLYNEEQRKRHNVKPGVTGWAQVHGRNAVEWDEKFKLDTWYVENKSFMLDIKILFLTIKKVLIREGITSENNVTVDSFKGNKK
ncbi:sugar transferase [Vibrio sp. MACH09]|uniref:sugar transferase n=1 Tax=Vibrio sp. MACH09 TaxID=3025122 RepID=UPI002792985B|nr:sugar transferase [Vibrio sp. MACH09]GLO59660.1 sugar transferase [Vibrio sp. MACH09]